MKKEALDIISIATDNIKEASYFDRAFCTESNQLVLTNSTILFRLFRQFLGTYSLD